MSSSRRGRRPVRGTRTGNNAHGQCPRFGVISGTIGSALAIKNMGKEVAERYAAERKAGKTLLAFSGDEADIAKARNVLEAHRMHTELLEH